jgi:acetyl esterase/lipase
MIRSAFLFFVAISGAFATLGAQVMTFGQLASRTAPAPDHRIAYGDGPFQFGNLRLPKGPGPHPVIVYIHGGCWLSQYDIAHAAPLEQALADSGFAVWSLEYRRIGNDGGGWPGTFSDIAKGTDHLRSLAPRYALDLNRVIASGHSAGGTFALWLAARSKIPQSSELFVSDPLRVRGVLGLAPAPDLEGLHSSGVCGNVIDKLMGGSPASHPDRYTAASPMQLSPIGVPQQLVIGALDRQWMPIGRSYVARAGVTGDTQVEVVEAPASGHFEMLAPDTSTWPLVVGALKQLIARIGR